MSYSLYQQVGWNGEEMPTSHCNVDAINALLHQSENLWMCHAISHSGNYVPSLSLSLSMLDCLR